MRKKWTMEQKIRGQNQRAKQAGARHDLTLEQWLETLEYFNHKCAYCSKHDYEFIVKVAGINLMFLVYHLMRLKYISNNISQIRVMLIKRVECSVCKHSTLLSYLKNCLFALMLPRRSSTSPVVKALVVSNTTAFP